MRFSLASVTWRDSAGRELSDYPRPSVAVDVALLTVLPGPPRLSVLVHPRDEGQWSLPGTFLHQGERLRDAALRALATKAGVTGEDPEQLRAFDDPGRDPRGWVLSMAHVDLVPARRLESRLAPGCLLAPVQGRPPRVVVDGTPGGLAFDHDLIVDDAVRWARAAYAAGPDPRGLLGEAFTLSELRRLHEAVLGVELQRDTFRRAVEGQVEQTGELRRGSVGKPARLFRHARGGG